MPKADSKSTRSTRPARARLRNPHERAAARKIVALCHRINLKRDNMMRHGLSRIVREIGDYNARQRRLLLTKMFEFGEKNGTLMTAAKRRAAEKGGAR
jgi:hypothetical protein